MPLIKDGVVVTDEYTLVGDDDALPVGNVIVTLVRFEKDKAALLERNVAFGVQLKSSESPEALAEEIDRISLVVLEFPIFRDGRAFSWARMLRERMKFTGEIRASGHFLYDQLAFMHRVGFTAYDVPDSITTSAFQQALAEMTDVYQPSADGRKTIEDLRTAR